MAVPQIERRNVLKFSGDSKGLNFHTWSWFSYFWDKFPSLRENTSKLSTFFFTSPLSPWNLIENLYFCFLPFPLLLFTFSWIWTSLQYWGQVEVLRCPASFPVFLGHEWSASDAMVYSLWASLVWFTRKIPVATNYTSGRELEAESPLPASQTKLLPLPSAQWAHRAHNPPWPTPQAHQHPLWLSLQPH